MSWPSRPAPCFTMRFAFVENRWRLEFNLNVNHVIHHRCVLWWSQPTVFCFLTLLSLSLHPNSAHILLLLTPASLLFLSQPNPCPGNCLKTLLEKLTFNFLRDFEQVVAILFIIHHEHWLCAVCSVCVCYCSKPWFCQNYFWVDSTEGLAGHQNPNGLKWNFNSQLSTFPGIPSSYEKEVNKEECLHSLVTVSCVSESLPYTQKGFSRHGLFRMTPVTAVLGGRGLDVALGRVNIRLHLVLPLGLPLFYLCLQTTSLHSGWSGFGQVSALLYVFVSLRYLGVPWIISWTSLHTDSGTKQLGGKSWWSY